MTQNDVRRGEPPMAKPAFVEALALRLRMAEGAAFDLEDLRATLGDGSDVALLQVTTADPNRVAQVVKLALDGAPKPILGIVALVEVASRQRGFFESRRLIPLLRTIAGDDVHMVPTFELNKESQSGLSLSLWVRFAGDARRAVDKWQAASTTGSPPATAGTALASARISHLAIKDENL